MMMLHKVWILGLTVSDLANGNLLTHKKNKHKS